MNAEQKVRHPISRETPFEGFFAYMQAYLSPERFDPWLTQHQSPYTRETLTALLQSNAFQQALERQWDYERDAARWGGRRSTHMAISEAIGHGLSVLYIEAERPINKKRFPDKSSAQLVEIRKQITVLDNYFNEIFPHLIPQADNRH